MFAVHSLKIFAFHSRPCRKNITLYIYIFPTTCKTVLFLHKSTFFNLRVGNSHEILLHMSLMNDVRKYFLYQNHLNWHLMKIVFDITFFKFWIHIYHDLLIFYNEIQMMNSFIVQIFDRQKFIKCIAIYHV